MVIEDDDDDDVNPGHDQHQDWNHHQDGMGESNLGQQEGYILQDDNQDQNQMDYHDSDQVH
ncbi:hypothetical protein HDU76_001437, partial [Blyttiomyces sp. JEL0837]